LWFPFHPQPEIRPSWQAKICLTTFSFSFILHPSILAVSNNPSSYFWRIYEMDFPEGSNMRAPEGLEVPLGASFFRLSFTGGARKVTGASTLRELFQLNLNIGRSAMKRFKGILSVIMLGFFIFLLGCATLDKGSGERVRLKEPRIKPLPESEATGEIQKQLISQKQRWGQVPNIYATLANHPKYLEPFGVVGGYIARGSTLPPRERQILILRIGWLCRSEYEFGAHTTPGKMVGLTDEEIKRITEGPKAPGWSAFDAALLQATDELYYDAFITNATWDALGKKYNQQQLIDVVATVGHYNLVSMLLNSLGVQLEKVNPGFPKLKDK
jgi:4-carboxymuconolactone decarboxylase